MPKFHSVAKNLQQYTEKLNILGNKMKVCEFIKWLETQNQDAEVELIVELATYSNSYYCPSKYGSVDSELCYLTSENKLRLHGE